MPRPRSLSPDQIAAAALAVVERDGLAALSMRAVATELGAGTMSLYRYVSGRDELEELLLAHALAGIPTEADAAKPWGERIVDLAVGVWRAVGDRPAIVPLLLTRRARTAQSIRTVVRAAATRDGVEVDVDFVD